MMCLFLRLAQIFEARLHGQSPRIGDRRRADAALSNRESSLVVQGMGSFWSGVVTVFFEYNTIKTVQIKCVVQHAKHGIYSIIFSSKILSHPSRLRAARCQSQP